MDGLTHRSVAAAADVPLGSTTYHFADKDALLLAAIDLAMERSGTVLQAAWAQTDPAGDLAGALASVIARLTGEHRVQLVVDYEIFLAARRRPAVQPRAALWVSGLYGTLAAYAAPLTARVLTDLVEGLLAQAVVLGRELREDELRQMFALVVRG